MRIVIVDTTMQGPLIGGAQTFLPLLMGGLKSNGHEVHLVTNGEPDKRMADQITASGAIVHTSLWKKNKLVQDVAPVFARWVNELQPAIYIISVSPDIGWLALPYLDSTIATFTIGHTDSETFYAPVRHYHSFITKAIAVSDQVNEEYIASCNLSPEQVNWIPYGVNVSETAPVDEKSDILKLIYVGRIDEHQKRVTDLAAIVKKLSALHTKFQLKVIGDGPEMPSFREKLSEEVANGQVELSGWQTNEAVVAALKKSSVFVLTSAYEGFCIALVEAMANGCTPVATNIRSGNKQLIQDEQNGFLIEIGDVDRFVDKLMYFQQNPSALATMRHSAWQTGKKYSVATMVAAYEKSFEEAIKQVKTSPRKTSPQFPLMESCQSKYPLWLRRVKQFVSNG